MKLLFRGHFFINAVDKVVIKHLMQRGKVYPSKKLPPPVPTPSPGSIPFNQVLMKRYLASLSLLGSMKSLGWIRFYWWVWYFAFNPPRSLDTPQKLFTKGRISSNQIWVLSNINIPSILYLNIYIYIYIYMYVCMYVCMYVYSWHVELNSEQLNFLEKFYIHNTFITNHMW